MGRPLAAPTAALAVSLGLHAALLCFLPGIRPLPESGETPLLLAELRPAFRKTPPAPAPRALAPESVKAPEARKPPLRKTRKGPAPATFAPAAGPATEPSIPARPPAASAGGTAQETTLMAEERVPAAPAIPPGPAERLPPRGRILFRVDWGDSEFVIGAARQEWRIEDQRYRLVSTVETTGLASLFRSVDIDMESLGRIADDGLAPEVFGVRRSGRKARERALFDWESMRIRVSDASDCALDPGAQDLLSFYYQLGFLDIAVGRTGSMPLATGKKYSVYPLENLGDETIELPLGTLITRHLRSRSPGERLTDIWLAYEYRLLPVKIRHVDNKGNAFVQVATEIRFGP
ncbi:MAG: DUF3108 domain-containing protein [Candidatus Accumulibacter sp.]|jgi:hypothetical protein|nr:DUF3108 domain-containing protein [Accumulibacter sp.]